MCDKGQGWQGHWWPGWGCGGPVRSGRYKLMASSASGRTGMASGSLSAWPPAGIVTDAFPPKVSA